MRNVKIVRLLKYGIFGLIFVFPETEPDTGPEKGNPGSIRARMG